MSTSVALDGLSSCLYDATVRHCRETPRSHAFTHHLPWWLIDLDELDALDRGLAGFGHNRAAPTALHDDDHFAPDGRSLRAKVTALLEEHSIETPGAGPRVQVLTQPRAFGYAFNPVSFWWCSAADGTPLALIAEINNTFGDRQAQVLDARKFTTSPGSTTFATVHPKAMHVSPFLSLDHDYHYRASVEPGQKLAVSIDVTDDEHVVLHTSLTGSRRPFTPTSALRSAVRLAPLRIIGAIHAHAFRLWRKDVPFHHKPNTPIASST